MAKGMPLHDYESLTTSDSLTGSEWVVLPEHAGHTMRVLGRIISSGSPTSMYIVRCEPCGEEYRMAEPTIARALKRQPGRSA